MARLVTSGRAALAAALKTRPIHFAWGRGEAWWNTRAELTATFAGAPQQIALPHAPVAAVVVSPAADPAAPYQTPEDYIWDAKTGVITRVIGGAIASGAAVKITVDYGRPVPPVDGTALLAEVCHLDFLIIATDEKGVCIDYKKPTQKMLSKMTTSECQKYLDEGQFPAGSMGPKVQAAMEFAQRTGKTAIITSIEDIPLAVKGQAGTSIVKG